MATNVNGPYGLKLEKAAIDQPLEMVYVGTGNGVAIGKGDVVSSAGDSAAIGTGSTVKTVSISSAGTAVYGVVMGVVPLSDGNGDPSLGNTYLPASTAGYLLVRVANNLDVYSCQADDVGTTLTHTNVSNNANITGNGGGTSFTGANTTTGMSTLELDSSTAVSSSGATLQLKIIGFVDKADNVIGSANQKLLVRFNNVESSGGTGTAAL